MLVGSLLRSGDLGIGISETAALWLGLRPPLLVCPKPKCDLCISVLGPCRFHLTLASDDPGPANHRFKLTRKTHRVKSPDSDPAVEQGSQDLVACLTVLGLVEVAQW